VDFLTSLPPPPYLPYRPKQSRAELFNLLSFCNNSSCFIQVQLSSSKFFRGSLVVFLSFVPLGFLYFCLSIFLSNCLPVSLSYCRLVFCLPDFLSYCQYFKAISSFNRGPLGIFLSFCLNFNESLLFSFFEYRNRPRFNFRLLCFDIFFINFSLFLLIRQFGTRQFGTRQFGTRQFGARQFGTRT